MLKCFCEEPLLLEPEGGHWYTTTCGHTFHYGCLTIWLLRSQTCPQCRKSVNRSEIIRLYTTSDEEKPNYDVTEIREQCTDNLKLHLQDITKKCTEKDFLITSLKDVAEFNEKSAYAAKNELEKAIQKINDLEQNINHLNEETKDLRENNLDLANNFENTESFYTCLQCRKHVGIRPMSLESRLEDMTKQLKEKDKQIDALKEVAEFNENSAYAAKKELKNAIQKINNLEQKINQLNEETKNLRHNNLDLENTLKKTESSAYAAKNELGKVKHMIANLDKLNEETKELQKNNLFLANKLVNAESNLITVKDELTTSQCIITYLQRSVDDSNKHAMKLAESNKQLIRQQLEKSSRRKI